MHKWITLLYTWNKHNIVNQLYTNIKFLKNEYRVVVVFMGRNFFFGGGGEELKIGFEKDTISA